MPEIGNGFHPSLKRPDRRYDPPIPVHHVPGALSVSGKVNLTHGAMPLIPHTYS
jgi:hypothetical protein